MFNNFFRRSYHLWYVRKCGGAREAADGNMAVLYTHTHTHTHKHVRLTAFPRQQWFRERAWILRYTYAACLLQNIT
jgi:hypothetical protein